jgi:predicted dehydrogenase
MEPVNFGIAGCGVIGPHHAAAIEQSPSARLVAVCDIARERAEALAGKHPGAVAYQDYEEMLKREDLEAVCICTPSGMHAEMTIAAARAGKHVLTEKPMDINLKKIDEMIRVCRERKVKLGVIFQRRTQRLSQLLRETVQSGRLGKMILGDAYLKYFRSQEYYDSGDWRGTWALDGGGCLMNQGVHMVDQLLWIMGPVESVFARADHLARRIEVEDTAAAVLRYRSGALGVLEASTATIGLDHRLELQGDRGSVVLEGEKITHWAIEGEQAPADLGSLGGGPSAAHDPRMVGLAGHLAQVTDLALAIREDREPMVTGEDGRPAVELILAVYESARSGKEVTLPLKR